MPSQITNYQCPACTGGLHFSSATGKLECEYCGSSFTVEEIEAFYAQKDEAAAQAQAKAEAKAEAQAAQAAAEGWDVSGMSADWGADAAGMKAYNCPSCGAELICDATTAATSCPYCGNPTIVPGQFHGALKPDYVIPFKLDKNAAIAALKNHYKGKYLLPKVFSDENHINEIKGVYVPFWLFTSSADADASYLATKTTAHREGDFNVVTTFHYQVHRSGSMNFDRVPVDGSTKMPNDYMDSLEPYDYSELKPFSTAYMPGYLADKFDVSSADSAKRVEERIRATAQNVIDSDVQGYASVSPAGGKININKGAVHYAMLPVWLLNTKWEGKDYLFAMNGQTGKLVGDLPIDKRKYRLALISLTVLIAAVLMLLGIPSWIARALL